MEIVSYTFVILSPRLLFTTMLVFVQIYICVYVYKSLANFFCFLNFFSYISTKKISIVFFFFFLFLKELDIAIVKATNHVEYPPKERHVRSELIYIPHHIIILNLFSNANDVILHFHLLNLMTFVLAQVSKFGSTFI